MNRDIDTGRVIEEVRLRKCLWDASDIFDKNKDARLKAWNDIVIALFEDVQENEKNDLALLIPKTPPIFLHWRTLKTRNRNKNRDRRKCCAYQKGRNANPSKKITI
ncbi:uncharacterized protein LOC123674505 [Harmonia axyridis]|uniref:uncharacterized protein LOC123674505 n=1 Tax=Harmonia axyridis TaxID=115357 RepID=UPI001E2771AD|nr:uncharacterized protein LOC123674505 [Harmonia axyridis]